MFGIQMDNVKQKYLDNEKERDMACTKKAGDQNINTKKKRKT